MRRRPPSFPPWTTAFPPPPLTATTPRRQWSPDAGRRAPLLLSTPRAPPLNPNSLPPFNFRRRRPAFPQQVPLLRHGHLGPSSNSVVFSPNLSPCAHGLHPLRVLAPFLPSG